MIIDILTAFVFAWLFQFFAFISKPFKTIIILVSCTVAIIVYFASGCQINYAGKTDFAVWILFVIIFNILITIGLDKLKKHIKE